MKINFNNDCDIIMDCAQLTQLIFDNPNIDVCVFTPTQQEEGLDPDEFTDNGNAIFCIVKCFPNEKFCVGIRCEDTHNYFCVNVIYNKL